MTTVSTAFVVPGVDRENSNGLAGRFAFKAHLRLRMADIVVRQRLTVGNVA